MKKCLVFIFIVMIITLFSGCEPITTYTKEEVQDITNDIKAQLLDLSSQSYHLSKELSDRKSENLIQREFIRVEGTPSFNCAYEIEGEDKHIQYFYKDDTLYTFNVLLNEKQQEKKAVSSLDFFHGITSDLSNISNMFDDKYISKMDGYSFVFSDEVSSINIKYKFHAKRLYEDTVLDVKYDKINISVSVDPKSNKKLHLQAEFIAGQTCLTYVFESGMYIDEYEILKERLKFPDDLERYKVR